MGRMRGWRGELLQFDGPVGVVEEVFPGGVLVGTEAEVNDGVALGFDGSFQQVHVGLVRGAAAFFGVAVDAGADEVVPRGFAAEGARDDVIEGEFLGGELLAAVLAEGVVAGVDVAAVEFDVLAREAVVGEKADDAGDGNFEADGFDKVVVLAFVLCLELREFDPGVNVVGEITGVFDGDDFGKIAEEEGESATGGDDSDRHVEAVEDQDVTGETRHGECCFHRGCSEKGSCADDSPGMETGPTGSVRCRQPPGRGGGRWHRHSGAVWVARTECPRGHDDQLSVVGGVAQVNTMEGGPVRRNAAFAGRIQDGQIKMANTPHTLWPSSTTLVGIQ
jgi:hypothetical protein